MEWDAHQAAIELHRCLDLRDTVKDVRNLFAQELQAAYDRGKADERDRIARAIDAEADVTPDHEDQAVTRGLAWLVRADFSYEDAERLEAEAESAADDAARMARIDDEHLADAEASGAKARRDQPGDAPDPDNPYGPF